MGKSGKLFKDLVTRAFKSPFKEKPEKDKSAANPDKNRRRKRNTQKCLWSVGKSASRNQDSFAPEVAFLDAPKLESTEVGKDHGKDVPITDQLLITKPDHGPRGVIKAEDVSFDEWDPTDPAKQEERAAIKIQAAYRRHLLASHQDFRALRAVVRLQALVRGHTVRKHASATLRCIQALVKLQALARGRRVRVSELGQLIQKHLQQTKQRKRLVESWVSSMVPVQPLQAKAENKQVAVVKRQCALVYTFSEQLNKCETKQNPSSTTDFRPDTSHWRWVWLERWMAAHPWGHRSDVTKEEQSKENMVCIKADVEVNPMSDGRDGSCLHIKDLRSSHSTDDFVSLSHSSPSATEREAMPILVQTREDCRDMPADLETAQVEPKAETVREGTLERPLLSHPPVLYPPPPPPPPPPAPHAQRPKSIDAYRTSSHEGSQIAISANTPFEMSLTNEAHKETSSRRKAEQFEDPCASTLESSSAITLNMPFEKSGTMEALHTTSSARNAEVLGTPSTSILESSSVITLNMLFEKSRTMEALHIMSSARNAEVLGTPNTSTLATHLEPVDLTRSPVKGAIPSTSVRLSTDISTTQITPQGHPDSPLHAKHHISRPIAEASDLVPSSASHPPLSGTTSSERLVLPQTEPPLSPDTFSEMLVLSPHSHTIACSLSSSPDVAHDGMSKGAYTRLDNENMDSTSSMVVKANGFNEGEVTEVSVRHGSMDKKDFLIVIDMDAEGTESDPDPIDCKSDETMKATPHPGANGGSDANSVCAGEKSTEVSPSKDRSPVSKQGQHTETVSPPLPKYMTTTQSSQAKIRNLTSLNQNSGSPKQKRESPKPRFETSKQKLVDSPKLKFQSQMQKEDSHKQRFYPSTQKLDSPKPRRDEAATRRNSLSGPEGKSTLTPSKSTLTAKVRWHL